MATNGEKKLVPPYIPYRTFTNWMTGLQAAIPARIDRSVLGNMAGVVQSQLISSLKYLHLIDEQQAPSATLEPLVRSQGVERQKLLLDLLKTAYPFMFPPHFNNLAGASPRMLEEQFENQGVTGDTVRKCLAFFLFVARDAGIQISPHVKMARRSRRNSTPRVKRSVGFDVPGTLGQEAPDSPKQQVPTVLSELLAKFPTLDPAWPDDVKGKWFESFDRLMKTVQGQQ